MLFVTAELFSIIIVDIKGREIFHLSINSIYSIIIK